MKRQLFVNKILADIGVLDFTKEIAEIHAAYTAQLLKQKKSVGSHDLIIAATAAYYHYPLVTRNLKDFASLEHLTVVEYKV